MLFWAKFLFSLLVFKVYDDIRVEKDISDVVSLLWIFAEHVLQKVDARLADFRPNFSSKKELMVQNSLFNLIDARPFEWHLATKELISHDTEAPDITFEVTRLLHDSFR